MENINQIFYFTLTIFISSMFFNAFFEFKSLKKDSKSELYWILQLILLTVWTISFTIAPNTSYFFLTTGNTANFGATICAGLLLRSLNHTVTKRLEITLTLIILAYGIFFEYLRIEENFIARTYLVIVALICANLWLLKETWATNRKNKSIHLNIILIIVTLQVLSASLRLSPSIIQATSLIKTIYHETGSTLTIRILWSSSFLLLCSFINNYFYEKTSISKRRIINELEEKNVKLLEKTKENNKIKALLEERTSLINSLILANKTAATGALSASIAHELNQPITAIQINTDYLKTRIDNKYDNHASLKEVIEDIQNDNQRAARIIRTLKDIFKDQQIETKPTDLNEVIQNIIPIIEPKIRTNNIQLALELQATSLIKLNKCEFQQVILNLINNAIDALTNLKSLKRKITICTSESDDYLEFSIIDNGIGVPKKLEASLFMLMKTNKQSGMGLGLWLSKHIVDRHNGQISYQKTQEGYIKFLIKLPIKLER